MVVTKSEKYPKGTDWLDGWFFGRRGVKRYPSSPRSTKPMQKSKPTQGGKSNE